MPSVTGDLKGRRTREVSTGRLHAKVQGTMGKKTCWRIAHASPESIHAIATLAGILLYIAEKKLVREVALVGAILSQQVAFIRP